MDTVCSVSGCIRPIFVQSRKLCSAHYNRWRTTGTTDDGPRARAGLEERLRRQIDKRGPDECWPWTARSRTAGYGVIAPAGRGSQKVLAHRAAWEMAHGPIPDGGPWPHGYVVMHTCDNRLCCNPAHLRLGTQADNVADMDAKRRRKAVVRLGEAHHTTKITADDVRLIRSGKHTNKELAERFGMHPGSIKNIKRGMSWKHVK